MNVAETTRVSRRPSAPVCVDPEDRLPAFTTRGFLDDQRWLLRRLDAPGPFADRVERLDGWYLVLHPETTRLDLREARAFFQERFGPDSGALRHTRFLAICRFLHENRADIVRCGLSVRDEPLTVREELVQFLIRRYTRPGETIPHSALTRFLDEWGHRWI
jgi:hypothetical protein